MEYDKNFLSASEDGSIKLYDHKTRNCKITQKDAHNKGIFALIQLNSNTIVTGDKEGVIKIWKLPEI